MKKTLILLGALLATACNPVQTSDKDSDYIVDATKTEAADKFEVICLDGVQYWVNRGYGHNNSVLAPRINPQTNLPARCPQLEKRGG